MNLLKMKIITSEKFRRLEKIEEQLLKMNIIYTRTHLKFCLMRSFKTRKYAKYYLLLEKRIAKQKIF